MSACHVAFSIRNNGDRRSGIDRRQFLYSQHIPERRSGRERRSRLDRRKDKERRADLKMHSERIPRPALSSYHTEGGTVGLTGELQ